MLPSLALLFFLTPALSAHAVDWMQPPVGCVEDVVPRPPRVACPDLSSAEDPMGYPPGLGERELQDWLSRRQELLYCQAKEILAREERNPGSQPPERVHFSWIRVLGGEKSDAKINAIYDAAEKEGLPPQILAGALSQESLLAELGIRDDGGNYSCGIGQLNLREWCRFMEGEHESTRRGMGWPVDPIRSWEAGAGRKICEWVERSFPAAHYARVRARNAGLPEYRYRPEHFAGIGFSEVEAGLSGATPDERSLQFALVSSFAAHCSSARTGIFAKARELRHLHETEVPEELRAQGRYAAGGTFLRACRRPYRSEWAPLAPSWLLADAVFNGGEILVDAIAHSRGSGSGWGGMTPQDLIASLYSAGTWNASTSKFEFEDRRGSPAGLSWMRVCTAQRHVAFLIRYVSLPGMTLAKSLEGEGGCSPDRVPLDRLGGR